MRTVTSPRIVLIARTKMLSCAIGFAFVALWMCAAQAGETPGAAQARSTEPLVAWDGTTPTGAALGEPIDVKRVSYRGTGQESAWLTFRLVAPREVARAAACRPQWVPGEGGAWALALAVERSESIYDPARRAATLVCGETLAQPRRVTAATLVVRFCLTGGFVHGGAAPQRELDGLLLDVKPGLALLLSGRGESGKAPRVPVLRVAGRGTFTADIASMDDEVPVGAWLTLAAVWRGASVRDEGAVGGDDSEVVFYLNGQPLAGRREGAATVSAADGGIDLAGPVRVGGDGEWSVSPVELGGFAVYGRALSGAEIAAASSGRSYERHEEANRADAWMVENGDACGLSVEDDAGGVLKLQYTAPTEKDAPARLLLNQPLALDDVNTVNVWLYQPPVGRDYGVQLTALFGTTKGTVEKAKVASLVSTHIAPGNTRKAGVWLYPTIAIPEGKGVSAFLGFEAAFSAYGGNRIETPGTLYLHNLGLDRIRYDEAKLYYVIGNFRDNYAMTGFNGCGAKALTDRSGGSDVPYILLDNAVDAAKEKRPALLRVAYAAYDESDRVVYAGVEDKAEAQTPADFLRKLPVPVTAPGTYRVESRSYDAATGAYFTTEWTQLIVIRGEGRMADLPEVAAPFALHVNADKPFGRLAKSDPRELQLRFVSQAMPRLDEVSGIAAAELRLGVIANQTWVPGRAARRAVELAVVGTASEGGTRVPYEPKAAVDLAVAEVWRNNVCLDRAERLVGIDNRLDAAPKADDTIPTLDDLCGTSRIWMNSQFHALEVQHGAKALEYLRANIDEIKKLTPLIGMSPPVEKLEPIPGVYDWSYLQGYFDLAAEHGCRVVLYLAQKWPSAWAPVDFFEANDGTVHRNSIVWKHMVGGYNYATGRRGPEILRELNRQLARRFLNHPGFGGYYFENEHVLTGNSSLPLSQDAGNRERYAAWLRGRYGEIDNLNRRYGTRYAAFTDVRIPDGSDVRFPRKIMQADIQEYRNQSVESFILNSQFDAVRSEDKRRPILIYHPGGHMSAGFYRRLAENGGMLANGGVHSDIDVWPMRETYNAIPGLRERMEPHDMWHYEPVPFGFDEMIFGMLAMGGRGLNFHYFLSANDGPRKGGWTHEGFLADKRIGQQRINAAMPVLEELARTEKQHDAVGILDLRKGRAYCGSQWTPGHRPLTAGIAIHGKIFPKYYRPNGELRYLEDSKLLLPTGEVIAAAEAEWLVNRVAGGAFLVLTETDAAVLLEAPDERAHALLSRFGIASRADGGQVAGIDVPHDAFTVGTGSVLLLRRGMSAAAWRDALPGLLSWAGIANRLADSDDPYMQIHVLKHDEKTDVWYMATTHRGYDINAFNGPRQWSGNVKFCQPLTAPEYRVTELWSEPGKQVGVFAPQQLAAGFDAGAYEELQMKIFRIEPAASGGK